MEMEELQSKYVLASSTLAWVVIDLDGGNEGLPKTPELATANRTSPQCHFTGKLGVENPDGDWDHVGKRHHC